MKKLSRWAKTNPKSSRIIIGFSHFFAVLNAFCLGAILFIFDFGESKWLSIIVANLFFISYLLYPEKGTKNKLLRHSYTRQKVQDFALVVFYSVVIALGVNNFLVQNNYDYNLVRQPTAEFVVQKLNSDNQAITPKSLKSEVKGQIKNLKKQIRHEFRELKKEIKNQPNKGWVIALKILLTLLTIGFAILLGYFIAALACNIACSGQEGLAWVVLILGWGGIIWLGIILIKKIFKQIGKKETDSNTIENN